MKDLRPNQFTCSFNFDEFKDLMVPDPAYKAAGEHWAKLIDAEIIAMLIKDCQALNKNTTQSNYDHAMKIVKGS